MNDADQYLIVGKVVGYYGLQGWLKIKPFTESMESFQGYEKYFTKQGEAFNPMVIDRVKIQGNSMLLKINGIEDRTAAEKLGKVEIAIKAESLPELDSDEYYWHELIGLTVTTGSACLGQVSGLIETGSNDVLVVKPSNASIDDRERLLPYRPEVILNVNLAAGELVVDWDSEF